MIVNDWTKVKTNFLALYRGFHYFGSTLQSLEKSKLIALTSLIYGGYCPIFVTNDFFLLNGRPLTVEVKCLQRAGLTASYENVSVRVF